MIVLLTVRTDFILGWSNVWRRLLPELGPLVVEIGRSFQSLPSLCKVVRFRGIPGPETEGERIRLITHEFVF